jgi:hypothetical protein
LLRSVAPMTGREVKNDDARFWHFAAFRCAARLVAYWVYSGQTLARRLNSSAAIDPERTLCGRRIGVSRLSRELQSNISHSAINEHAEPFHPHFIVRSKRQVIISFHECHGRTTIHVCLQFFEHCAGKAFSAFAFGNTNRTIQVTIGGRRENAPHGLNNRYVRLRSERCPQNITDDFAIAPANDNRLFEYRAPEPIRVLPH